jgi:hypothetical protein
MPFFRPGRLTNHFLKKINGFNYPAEKLFIKIEFESFGKKEKDKRKQ